MPWAFQLELLTTTSGMRWATDEGTCAQRLRRGESVPGERVSKWRSSRQCGRKATLLGSYAYVTGRGGNVSDRLIPLCSYHGERWASEHGVAHRFHELEATDPRAPGPPRPAGSAPGRAAQRDGATNPGIDGPRDLHPWDGSSSAATRVQGADAERRADPGVTPGETGPPFTADESCRGAAQRGAESERPIPQIPTTTREVAGWAPRPREGDLVSPQAPDSIEPERDGPEWDPEDVWVPCGVCRRALVNAGSGHDTCAGCLARI